MTRECARCHRSLPSGQLGGNCPACLYGSALEDEPIVEVGGEEEVPVELGEYEILGEIGRGGTGIVYRARQRRLNRVVALKTLQGPALGRRDGFERLQTEAQAVARLDHPNIVPLYEVGRHAGTHFLALRYFEGGSLADVLKGRRFSAEESARLLATAARAVHHAHSRGVLHRDLKPSNLLLDEDGAPHVSDFGLAKLADGGSSLTLSTTVLGTPAYMAPEQASGNTKEAGTPADIHALGAVLFELLTGRPPFQGRTALEVLRLVADSEPPRPRALVPGLDRDLEAVCLRCLEKDPGRRYSSAAALAEDLERWLRQEPLSVRRLSTGERLLKWMRRRPVVAGLGAALTLTLILGIAATVWGWRQAWAEREETARERYAASLSLAERHLELGETGGARQVLLEQPELLRGWEWGHLMAQAHDRLMQTPILTQLTNAPDGWHGMAMELSADGEWFSVGQQGAVEVRSATTGARVFQSQAAEDPIVQVCFHPDGRRFVTVQRGPTLRFRTLPGGEEERVLRLGGAAERSDPDGEPDRILLHPDGRRFVVWGVGVGSGMALRSLDTGEVEREFAAEDPTVGWSGGPRFSPDGDRLMRQNAYPTEVVWNIETGAVLGICPPVGDRVRSVVTNPEGTHFATVETNGVAGLWRVGGTAPYFRTIPDPVTTDGRGIWAAIPEPTHQRLVTVRELGSVKFWDTATGTLVEQSSVPVHGWVQTPAGPLVTIGERGRVHVWDWGTGQATRALGTDGLVGGWLAVDRGARTVVAVGATVAKARVAHAWPLAGCTPQISPPEVVFRAAFSPDGRRVATVQMDGQVGVWDAVTGERLRELRGHFRWASDVAWGGDGACLFSSSADHTLRQWNPDTGQLVRTLDLGAPVWSVTTDRAGSKVAASVQSGLVVVHDAVNGRLLHSWTLSPGSAAWQVRMSPDGHWLTATDTFNRGGVWDLQSGAKVHDLSASGGGIAAPVLACAYSPHGERIATFRLGGTLEILEVGTWRLLARAPCAPAVADLCFGADGERVFLTVMSDPSASSDLNAVDVHDARTGRRLTRLSAVKGWSPSIVGSSDGFRLLRSVVDYGIRPRGVEQWSAFPWKASAYATEPGTTLGERIQSWAHRRLMEQRAGSGIRAPVPPAGAWKEPRSNWEPRGADVPEACLDLTFHYNGHLDRCAFANDEWAVESWNFGAIPRGLVQLDGVLWDLRGLITTGRAEPARGFRHWRAAEEVRGIPVRRRARTLHVLHSAWHWAPEDVWGRYRLHYVDGTTADLEMRAWYDVAFWTWKGTFASDRPARVAWEGKWSGSNPENLRARMYHRAYPNPFPEKEILSIDLTGTGSSAAPFVAAITVE